MKHWITLSPIGATGVEASFDTDEHDSKDAALRFANEILLGENPPSVIYVARVEHSLQVERKVRVEGLAS